MEDDLDVRNAEGALIDDDGGESRGVGAEGDVPWSFAMAQALVASEERAIDDQREGKADREVAREFVT
jgi:hypothetical protein